MQGSDEFAVEFAQHRAHLRNVAYRMSGSLSDAEDAVQETWLRLERSDTEIVNLKAWLTTVVARICLDLLRSRTARREDPLDVHLPDPVLTADATPEQQVVQDDTVGLALLVVLDTLSPSERLAFVLHDVFAVPFDQIGPILDRSPAAAKQLASRARRRVRTASPVPVTDPHRQREVLSAFLAAARDGDFDRLLTLLDPGVLLRADGGAGAIGPSQRVRGAHLVAAQALQFAALARHARPVLVNGGPGFVVVANGQALSVLSATIVADRIVELNILADPERLAGLDLSAVIGDG